MAQVTTVELIDDITGDPAAETVSFMVRGVAYEFDASEETAKEFDEAVAGYIESARRVKATASISKRTATPGTQRASREQTQAVREWARGQGMTVSDRGRISGEIQQAFDAAHGQKLAAVG